MNGDEMKHDETNLASELGVWLCIKYGTLDTVDAVKLAAEKSQAVCGERALDITPVI